MKKVIGIIIFIGIIVFGYLFGIQKNPRSENVSEVITIGAPLSLSGLAVVDGESLQDGIELAVDDFAKEGIEIEVSYIDDRTEIKDTVLAMNLLASKNVQAIIGPTWSYLYSAAIPVANRERLVTIGPAITSEYAEVGDYGFQLSPKITNSEDILSHFLFENEINTISFIAPDYAWSRVHLENLEAAATSVGAEVISVEWMQFGEEVGALDTIIPKIKSQNPDLIFFEAGGDEVYAKLFSRLSQNELGVPVITATSDMARYIQQHAETVPDILDIYILTGVSSMKFDEYFRSQYGHSPGEYSEYGYDAVKVIVQAIQENGRENLKEYIESNTFKGFSRTYTFDENHDASNGEWVIRKDN